MPDFRKSEPDSAEKNKPIRVNSTLPEHFEPRCKVCTSKYRHAIERLIALGTSYSEIERTFGEEIPRRSISHHAKEHLAYEQAAVREIIEHEARIVQANYEEGLHGVLMHRTYLSTALKRAWDDLVEGNVRIDPAVAIQIIQQLDKFEKENSSVAIEELRFQFHAFMEAVKRTVPRDMWDLIFDETQKIVERGNDIIGEIAEG